MFALNRTVFKRLFHLSVIGRHHVPDRGPLIIAPNHISYLDGLVVAASLPYARLRQLRWVAYAGASLANPVTRLASRLAMMVPIDSDQAPLAGLASGAAVLRRKDILVWFPAGKRSPNGEVQDFQPGIGALADYFGVPIVPVIIDGTRRAMPPGSDLPRPRNVTIVYGPRLDAAELARTGRGDDDAERIINNLHDYIVDMRRDVHG